MAFDYSASAATAQRLLAQFGQAVTLSKTTPGAFDPVTGTSSGDVTVTQSATAVLLDYSLQESGARLAEGVLIRAGDKKCLIGPVVDWAPDEMTTLTDAAGVVWQLETVRTLAPAGLPVLYTANATR